MSRILIFIFISILYVGFIPEGCSKSPTIIEYSYDDMIQSLIMDSEKGHALFSPNIYSTESFLFGDSEKICFYSFDSTKRSISVAIAKNPKDIPPYNGIYDALATITDKYFGKLMQINGIDTTLACQMQNSIVRYGYFIKPYDDWYPYRGWQLWGFIGGKYSSELPPGNRFIVSSDGTTMPALPPQGAPPTINSQTNTGYYINIDDINKFPRGDSITLHSREKDLIFVETEPGNIISLNAILEGNNYQASWMVPSQTNKLYQLLLFDRGGYFVVDTIGQIVESTLIKTEDYLIPFGVKL